VVRMFISFILIMKKVAKHLHHLANICLLNVLIVYLAFPF
jgi:hypothetical protein